MAGENEEVRAPREDWALERDPYPDEAYLAYKFYTARAEFDRRDQRDAIREQAWWQENDIPHPAHVDFQEVHTGLIPNLIERAKGILIERPTAQVGSYNLNTLRVLRDESVQDAVNAVFPALEEQRNFDTWDHILTDQLIYGRSYDLMEYVPTDFDVAAGFPKAADYVNGSQALEAQRKFALSRRLPMTWYSAPARGCFTWYDDFGMQEAIVIEERRAMDIARRFNRPQLLKDLDQQARNPAMHVIFARYFNRTYTASWVAHGYASQSWEQRSQTGLSLLTLAQTHGSIIDVAPNIYGVVPVIETNAITTTSRNPAKSALSIADHVIPLAMYYDQLVSQQGSAIRVWAWPTPYIKRLQTELGAALQTVPTGPDGRPIPINIVPGKVQLLLPGEDVGWLVAPSNNANSQEQIALIEKLAGQLGIPGSLFDGSLGDNGYAFNSIWQAVRGSKFRPLIEHNRRSHKQRIEQFFRILQIHGDPLYIFSGGKNKSDMGAFAVIKPSDVDDWESRLAVNVLYEDRMPVDDAANLQNAIQATTPRGSRPPLLTDETAMKDILHMDDPQKEIARRRIQGFEEQPMVQQFLTMKNLKDAGMALDDEEMGTPQEALNGLGPEQQQQLPPALLQAMQGAAGGAGGQLPAGQPQAALAAGQGNPGPTGAAAAISPPGGSPPAVKPGKGIKPGPKRPGGRAAGQSRQPPKKVGV